MKRFYKLVSIKKAPDGFEIHLDGRPVKTPVRHTLRAPTKNLADALMQEWAEQKENINPDTMLLTQILSTRIDRVSVDRNAMEQLLMAYLDTDLVCYRADKPEELRRRQESIWGVSVSWLEERYSQKLLITDGLAALSQQQALHDEMKKEISAFDDDYFTSLQLICATSGSLILALALLHNAVNADHVFEAMRIEENYKAEIYDAEKYGPDPAQDKKDQAILRDLKAAEKYLELIS